MDGSHFSPFPLSQTINGFTTSTCLRFHTGSHSDARRRVSETPFPDWNTPTKRVPLARFHSGVIWNQVASTCFDCQLRGPLWNSDRRNWFLWIRAVLIHQPIARVSFLFLVDCKRALWGKMDLIEPCHKNVSRVFGGHERWSKQYIREMWRHAKPKLQCWALPKVLSQLKAPSSSKKTDMQLPWSRRNGVDKKREFSVFVRDSLYRVGNNYAYEFPRDPAKWGDGRSGKKCFNFKLFFSIFLVWLRAAWLQSQVPFWLLSCVQRRKKNRKKSGRFAYTLLMCTYDCIARIH